MSERLAVGVDLGGTNVRAAVVAPDGSLDRRRDRPSPDGGPADFAATVAELVRSVGDDAWLGVGIGAAGIVDVDAGRYVYGPNLSLRDDRIGERVRSILGVPVLLDNDANAAVFAEHSLGSGRGTRHFACVTLGTGIGGGLVVDGRVFRGAGGGAGEVGHMLVDPDGERCACGRRGCWEQYASGTALERYARQEAARTPSGATATQGTSLSGHDVTRAARQGDAAARRAVERVASWVGWGLGSLVNVFSPERICIAGGLSDDWDLFEHRASQALAERAEAPQHRPLPEVVRARFGSDAGVVGAGLLVYAAAARRATWSAR